MSDVDVSPSTIGHMSHSCICIVWTEPGRLFFVHCCLLHWSDSNWLPGLVPVGWDVAEAQTACRQCLDSYNLCNENWPGSYYVILCHALSYYIYIILYISLLFIVLQKPSSTVFSPNRLVLHVWPWLDVVCLNLFPNACGQVGQVEPAGRQKHQRLLEQLQSLLHLAVRRWMSKSRSPRRPLSCRQHHKCKTSKSSLPFLILSCSSFDPTHFGLRTFYFQQFPPYIPLCSRPMSPALWSQQQQSPEHSHLPIQMIPSVPSLKAAEYCRLNITGACSHHSRSQIHDASSCTWIPKAAGRW